MQSLKPGVNGKLRKMYECTDEEISFKPGKKDIWLTKLLQKIKNSKGLIKTVSVSNQIRVSVLPQI